MSRSCSNEVTSLNICSLTSRPAIQPRKDEPDIDLCKADDQKQKSSNEYWGSSLTVVCHWKGMAFAQKFLPMRVRLAVIMIKSAILSKMLTTPSSGQVAKKSCVHQAVPSACMTVSTKTQWCLHAKMKAVQHLACNDAAMIRRCPRAQRSVRCENTGTCTTWSQTTWHNVMRTTFAWLTCSSTVSTSRYKDLYL